MVRFARRKGDNQQKTEEATKWDQMFENKNEAAAVDSNEGEASNVEKVEKVEDKRSNKDHSKGDKATQSGKNSTSESSTSAKPLRFSHKLSIDQLLTLVEKGVRDDIQKLRDEKKITQEEFVDLIKKEARRNQRRLERIKERENDQSKVCFNCRKSGHYVSHCPEVKKDNEHGTGICYKCGTTEHSAIQCKVKVPAGTYPYAKCFICNETGHLSKQCPDNPRGLYPKGGACKNCSSVEHFARDCPTLKPEGVVEIKRIAKLNPKENVDDIADEDFKKNQRPADKNVKKVVKF